MLDGYPEATGGLWRRKERYLDHPGAAGAATVAQSSPALALGDELGRRAGDRAALGVGAEGDAALRPPLGSVERWVVVGFETETARAGLGSTPQATGVSEAGSGAPRYRRRWCHRLEFNSRSQRKVRDDRQHGQPPESLNAPISRPVAGSASESVLPTRPEETLERWQTVNVLQGLSVGG